ncbi:hypothetical protein KKE48_02940 [Patescibacteria group bacterium]|nr:hypothetical protein [Planctomycetota bacterium]MBU1499799.1 hypothetical protein [Patescibacteria group bacterium]
MNEFWQDRLTAVAFRAGGTGLGLGLQAALEKSAETNLKNMAFRLQDLGMVGDSTLSYLELALQIRLPSLMEAFERLNKLSLPNHLNPWAVGIGFMLAAGSLFADFKNGDWVARGTEEMEYNHPRLAKIAGFGGRLVQLASAGAIALTPQIITKAMELKMNNAQLAASWEGWVALMGVAVLAFPAAIDGIKAAHKEVKSKQRF